MSLNVVFDMDGLMFDSERLHAEAWEFAGSKAGISVSDTVKKIAGVSFEESKKIWNSEIGDKVDIESFYNDFIDFVKDRYENDSPIPKKGLYSILNYLKNESANIAVASNAHMKLIEHNLKSAKIYDYFKVIVSVEMVEHPKPAPEIYLKACELLGVSPQDTYALEDSRTGITAAYKAGCKSILIPDSWNPDEEILSHILAKYDDLEQVKNDFELRKI